MNIDRECKSCLETVHVKEDEIEKAIKDLERIGKTKMVDDITYESRLSSCSSCDHLEYGTTCMLCGCLVKIRAKLATGRCPYPKKSRWIK